MNSHNKKSLNLNQDLRRNHQVNKRENFKIENHEKPKFSIEID